MTTDGTVTADREWTRPGSYLKRKSIAHTRGPYEHNSPGGSLVSLFLSAKRLRSVTYHRIAIHYSPYKISMAREIEREREGREGGEGTIIVTGFTICPTLVMARGISLAEFGRNRTMILH